MAMEHLKSLLKSQDVSQTQLAVVLGRDKSAITNLLQGKRKLKADEVIKIARFLNVPEAKVLGIESVAPITTSSASAASFLGMSEGEAIAFMAEPSQQLLASGSIFQKDGRYYLSEATKSTPNTIALEVKDRSLDLSGVMPGDVVIVEMGRPAKPDDVVVVQYYMNDTAQTILRKYQPPFLLPHSSQMDMERLHEARETVRIVGPVVRLVRMMG